MKKLVSILSATLLATSLAACGSFEAKQVEVPAPQVEESAPGLNVLIKMMDFDMRIVCYPSPDGTFSAYHDHGHKEGFSRADAWDVVCNDHFEPVALNVTVVPAKQ